MARYEFILPDIGEGTAQAECVGWHVAVGEHVAEDAPLLDVMTDKATVELTSPVTGTVLALNGRAGEMLRVGSVVAVLDAGAQVAAAPDAPGHGGEPASPRPEPELAPEPPPARRGRILTTPAVRKRARDLGLDLAAIAGTGPNGRVRQCDLDAWLGKTAVPTEPRPVEAMAHVHATDDTVTEVPLTGLRRQIARRMQQTCQRVPHFSYVEEVEMSALERARGALNRRYADSRGKLTLLPFLIRAIARTLPAFPQLNAHFDEEAAVLRQYSAFHAGIATQTPNGLVVTVVRDAGRLGLWDLAREIARLAELARSGRAGPRDLSGSTLTISSLGPLGGVASTPVINSPEVAIIGVNKLVERPIVRDEAIAVAPVMNLSSSFDHRIVDGWDAASFVQQVRALLEEPALLLAE